MPENSKLQASRPAGWDRMVAAHLSSKSPEALAGTVQVRRLRACWRC